MLSNAARRVDPLVCGHWHQMPRSTIRSVGGGAVHDNVVHLALQLHQALQDVLQQDGDRPSQVRCGSGEGRRNRITC